MFEKIYQLIADFDTIIIHRHTSPDGDALGSQIGLKHIILENFPRQAGILCGRRRGPVRFHG